MKRRAAIAALCFFALMGLTPLPLFHGPQSVADLINYLNQLVQALNGRPPVVSVNTSNDLKGLATTEARMACTTGFASPGDGGGGCYTPKGSACVLGGGAGDNGFEVSTVTPGDCWILNIPVGGASASVWGAGLGGADDSAALQAAETAMASAAWPANAPQILRIDRPVTAKNWILSGGIKAVIGNANPLTTITLPASGTATDEIMTFGVAGGSFYMENIKFVCPSYIRSGAYNTSVPGRVAFLAETGAETEQMNSIVMRHVSVFGCNSGFQIYQTATVDADWDRIDEVYGGGFTVALAGVSANPAQASSRIHVGYCTSSSYWCGSVTTSTSDAVNPFIVPSNVYVKIDNCINNGYGQNKGCLDASSRGATNITIDVNDNGSRTALESKSSQTDANFYIGGMVSRNLRVTHTSPYDLAQGVILGQENDYTQSPPAIAPDNMRNVVGNFDCTRTAPHVWIANKDMAAGDWFHTTAGRLYVVRRSGQSGNSEPTGSSVNTGITDGTALVEFISTYNPISVNRYCLLEEALSNFDLTVRGFELAGGVTPTAQGSTDNTIRRGTLRVSGVYRQFAVRDSVSTEFDAAGIDQFVDKVSLKMDARVGGFNDWTASSWHGGPAALDGDFIMPLCNNAGRWIYQATTSGQTDSSTCPTFPQVAGNTVVDNGVTWKAIQVYSPLGCLILGQPGGTGPHYTTWTNMEIHGTCIEQLPGVSGAGTLAPFRTGGGSVSGKIMSDAYLGGYFRAMSLASPGTLNIMGGATIETFGGTAATGPVINATGALASGTVTGVGPMNVLNSNWANQPLWSNSGGAATTFSLNGVNTPTNGSPSGKCVVGDIAYDISQLHKYACSAVPNTWSTVY